MIIRRWKYTDISAIAAFEKQQFQDYWTYDMLADSYLNDLFYGYIAEENGKILGTAAFNLNLDEADLVNIIVAAQVRRSGLGSTLMETLLADCEKMELRRLFLEVRESNYPAIALYRKYGFEKVAVREKYYKDGERATVMRKDFNY